MKKQNDNKYANIVKRVKEELSKEDSLLNYINAYKDLESISPKDNSVEEKNKIRIAVLGSTTLNGFKEVLDVKCRLLGLYPLVYVAPYNQYNQEILNKNSGLYNMKPDLIILWIDSKTTIPENFYFSFRMDFKKRKEIIKDCFLNIIDIIKKITEQSKANVIIHNLNIPEDSILGILENKQEYGIIESIKDLNDMLAEHYKKDNRVFVFDFDRFMGGYGKKNVQDNRFLVSADMSVKPDFIPKICEEYLAYIKPMKSLNKKCLVLDLDNTLWGGIVGEDGFEGIRLSTKPPGSAFVEFQKYILSLYERGIILAINSKNNPQDALKVIKEHPDMILRENHFAAIKINWQDKVTNMREIATELNIGIDSLVFVDDDRMNCELIKEMLPEILTIELPKQPALYVKKLMSINDFNTLQLTEEDRQRGEMYVQQRRRTEVQKSAVNLEEFLKNLELKVTISGPNKFTIPRISQLTQKTNQFNMTTRRYLEEDINKFSLDKNYKVYSVKVKDKFGDNGLTGVVIIKKNKTNWTIETFLLSCRVLGREVEKVILAFITEKAKKESVKELYGEFIATEKNAPAKDFYKLNKFRLKDKSDGKEIWALDLSKNSCPYPKFIEVKAE